MALLSLERVCKRFDGVTAVDSVSFAVDPGEVVGFLGPNGAGKTTTMRMLLGILRPTSGEAAVDGPVGYVPEGFAAYEALSVRSYLRFVTRVKRVPADDADRAMAAAGVADL